MLSCRQNGVNPEAYLTDVLMAVATTPASETWRLGDLETWRLGDLETWRLGDSHPGLGVRPAGWKRTTTEIVQSDLVGQETGGWFGRTVAVRAHLDGIINGIVLKATNPGAESVNFKIQKIKRMACGFRNRDRFRAAIYFHLGGLDLAPATHTDS